MKIYTSYFGKTKTVKQAGILPVCIAVSIPRWYSGEVYAKLMPTYAMLNMSEEAYRKRYFEILGRLSASDVVKELEELSKGKDVAIMCYEKDSNRCHRNYVRNWLIEELGIEVEEFRTELERTEMPGLFD